MSLETVKRYMKSRSWLYNLGLHI